MNERDLPRNPAARRALGDEAKRAMGHGHVTVHEHTRKRQSVRPPITERQKLTTASTYALKGEGGYAPALAGVLRRWCGDNALAVARELVQLLENDQ